MIDNFVPSAEFRVPNSCSRRGFTLVETVIYIGLLSVIISFVLVVFYQIVGSGNQNRDRIEIDAEANFLMQKMIWALVDAQAINQPTVNTTSSVLSVNKYNYSQNSIVFDLSQNNLRISKASSTPVILNNGRVSLSRLIFEHDPQSLNTPESVKVTLGVVTTDAATPVPASTTITDTIYLRK